MIDEVHYLRGFKDLAENDEVKEQVLKDLDMLHGRVTELEKLVADSSASQEELISKTKELEKANIKLRDADRMKTIFIANMSHELRTPLNSIIGFTGLVLQGLPGDLNDDQRRQLNIVKNSGNQLLELIGEILDLSQVEAGMIDLAIGQFDIADMANEALSYFRSAVDAKKLDLVQEVPENVSVRADKKRIKQILMNLMSNAVKFTEEGSIIVSVGTIGKSLKISVKDTGVGMGKEYLSRVFRPFQQVEMVRIRTHQGTGLGLYLSKRLAKLMGGDIAAFSEYGVGSEFVYITPVEIVG